jgi:hypothetical protein
MTCIAKNGTDTSISTTIIPVEHVVVRTKRPYIEVKAALETRLGRLDSDILSLLRENKIGELRGALKRLVGRDGLAIHYVAAHGDWLILNGGRRNGIVYYIGNVLSAVEMIARTSAPVCMRRCASRYPRTKTEPHSSTASLQHSLRNFTIRRSMKYRIV